MTAAAANYRAEACPDLETIAAFLDARLDERERELVAAHLAACDKCYFLLAEASQVQTTGATASAPQKRFWTRRMVIGSAAAGLAAAAALVIAVRVIPSSSQRDPALGRLVAAVGSERLMEPRVTGGFAYGPIRAVRSSNSIVSLSPDVRIEAARIEKDTASQRSADALHTRGVAALVVGEIDQAVTALETALAQRPSDAEVLNDLAAAYLVRATRNNDQSDVSKALALLNRAIEANRVLPEARFNRAYALDRLAMTSEARDGWQDYLTIDNRSAWADEARLRLRALSPER